MNRAGDIRLIRRRTEKELSARSAFEPQTLFVTIDPPRLFARNGFCVPMAPHDALIFMAIIGQLGGIISHESLVELVWGDDPDGAPNNPTNVLHVRLAALRPVAAFLGYRIDTRHGVGFSAHCIFSNSSDRSSLAKAAADLRNPHNLPISPKTGPSLGMSL